MVVLLIIGGQACNILKSEENLSEAPKLILNQGRLQRRGERRATINEEVGGVYDVNVL